MKMFLTIGIASIALLFSQSALVAQSFDVSETCLDFGMVDFGSSKIDIVTVTNNGPGNLIVTTSMIDHSRFELLEAGSIVIEENASEDFCVEFTPGTELESTAVLDLQIGSGASAQIISVGLIGNGGECTNPTTLVDMILEFFDDSVADGTLVGMGSGYRANRRLRAMRNRIRAIDFLIREGYDNAAIFVTFTTILRSDGENQPRDLVEGAATEELNGQLELLFVLLGG